MKINLTFLHGIANATRLCMTLCNMKVPEEQVKELAWETCQTILQNKDEALLIMELFNSSEDMEDEIISNDVIRAREVIENLDTVGMLISAKRLGRYIPVLHLVFSTIYEEQEG